MAMEPDCAGCRRVRTALSGEDPAFIAELQESVVLVHEHQPLRGWVVLMLKNHAEHLGRMPVERQVRLAQDVAETAAALDRAFAPRRINYECLGNVLAHVHWHIIPRYSVPVDPGPSGPVWTFPPEVLQRPAKPDEVRAVVEALRGAGLGSTGGLSGAGR
jgi:diadenosine tetraphosphate (Ap4A) HIT family hydrolase